MKITDLHNPWRDKWVQAQFREAKFFVENGVASGGRRVAVHQYPKRNVPYAEDMGRTAQAFSVQGYLIGPDYLDLKDDLIAALETDGPGLLRLPMQYMMSDVRVMVQSYAITENRERGGMCGVMMEFVEFGNPVGRANIATSEAIMQSSSALESAVITPQVTENTAREAAPFLAVHQAANIPIGAPTLP